MYRAKLHKLIDIIFITLSATLCGYDGWEEIELFAKAKVDWLSKYVEGSSTFCVGLGYCVIGGMMLLGLYEFLEIS